MYRDERHLRGGSRSNPTERYRHGAWLLRTTADTREHRRELRKGRIDRRLLRAGSVRARVMAVRNDTCNWLRTSNSMKGPASRWRSPSASVVKIGEGVDEGEEIGRASCRERV